MLFNSPIFLFAFLPVLFIGLWVASRYGNRRAPLIWLTTASLAFYGWWDPKYLILISASMVFNFLVGRRLGRQLGQDRPAALRKSILTIGVAVNLGLLGYFKYANFLLDNLNLVAGTELSIAPIVLPLAISFFTFQQIAYLVDAFRGETREYDFLKYALFVVFFPQLIAGPIVHHAEVLPQFERKGALRFRSRHLAVGWTVFVLGLFKKVVIADSVAPWANDVFDAAARGEQLSLFPAWGGALAYTVQLYFDFSGYSDMAIGLGRMFGIRLPINFNSPYKATSISDFWRRWHITLSRFLRDYLYIPLGGSRRGVFLQRRNLMLTMLLGGLWHGAGWTFVIWGGLHGIYLVIHHTWAQFRLRLDHEVMFETRSWRLFSRLLTFVAVVIGWVFFRATTLDAALSLLRSMAGLSGVEMSQSFLAGLGSVGSFLQELGVRAPPTLEHFAGIGESMWIVLFLLVAWCLPNTQECLGRYRPALCEHVRGERAVAPRLLRWRPSWGWAVTVGVILALCLTCLHRKTEFLYFQF